MRAFLAAVGEWPRLCRHDRRWMRAGPSGGRRCGPSRRASGKCRGACRAPMPRRACQMRDHGEGREAFLAPDDPPDRLPLARTPAATAGAAAKRRQSPPGPRSGSSTDWRLRHGATVFGSMPGFRLRVAIIRVFMADLAHRASLRSRDGIAPQISGPNTRGFQKNEATGTTVTSGSGSAVIVP